MKQETYEAIGWDFKNVWIMSDTFPVLRFESEGGSTNPPPVDPPDNILRINDDDSRIVYGGSWTYAADAACYNGDKHYTSKSGATAELSFTGPYIAWIGTTNANQGTADVFIDGVPVTQVDLSSSTPETQKELFVRDDLSAGSHIIRIVANSKYINIDAFDVAEENTPPPTGDHTVTVVTRYQDGALPDETQVYYVNDGDRFEAHYDILPGYEVYSNRLQRASFTWGIIESQKLVVIDPVHQDYTVELEFYKNAHTVTVVLQYSDGTPGVTYTFEVLPGDTFNEQIEISAGYAIDGFFADSPDAYLIKGDRRVMIDSVTQDTQATILLI